MQRDDLVSLLYAGLLDGEAWQAALHGLVEMANANHVITLAERQPDVAAPAPVLAWTARVAEEFLPVVTSCGQEVIAMAESIAIGKAMQQSALLPDEILHRTDLYVDHVRPMGGHFGLVARPFEGAFITICRPEKAGAFSSSEFDSFQQVLPALEAAMRLKRRLTLLESQLVSAECAMDSLDVGIILLDPQRRPYHVNAAAERILRGRDGLDWTPAGPVAAREADTNRLCASVAAANGEACLLPRPSGKRPLVLRVVPIDGGRNGQHYANTVPGCLAVYIRDPDHQIDQQVAPIAAAFNLTPQETAVARLFARGLNLAGVAAELEITIGNARVHLKKLFQKTETHSQAELMRLLLTVQS
jgi:DNA-binding CsgD family transcriptional regulator/PAS domain-containing protein